MPRQAKRQSKKSKATIELKTIVLLALCVAAPIVLTGCSGQPAFRAVAAGVSATAQGWFLRPDVNLKEKNYAAADFIEPKLKKPIGPFKVIRAQPLHEVDNPGITSPLGMKIPEEIGLRLIDLGYKVDLGEVASEVNTEFYAGSPIGMQDPEFILTGSYLRNRKDLDVHLRVVETRSSHVIASFDYKMALTVEVRKLSETPTRIFRVSK